MEDSASCPSKSTGFASSSTNFLSHNLRRLRPPWGAFPLLRECGEDEVLVQEL